MPTLLFVNKIDRGGADCDRVVSAIRERLTADIVPMGTAQGVGTRAAEFTPFGADDAGFRASLGEVLAANDEGLLSAYVEDETGLPYQRLAEELASQTARVLLHPVFFGSAVTGAGVRALMRGIAECLPSSESDDAAPPSGLVFKIERGAGGEKIAYIRMFSGVVRARQLGTHGNEASHEFAPPTSRLSLSRVTPTTARALRSPWPS